MLPSMICPVGTMETFETWSCTNRAFKSLTGAISLGTWFVPSETAMLSNPGTVLLSISRRQRMEPPPSVNLDTHDIGEARADRRDDDGVGGDEVPRAGGRKYPGRQAAYSDRTLILGEEALLICGDGNVGSHGR